MKKTVILRYMILILETGVLFYSEILQIRYHELNDAYRMILQTCWRYTSLKIVSFEPTYFIAQNYQHPTYHFT